ncbi:hypothetical protein OCU04_006922 [Sclerotinia nivalis]|uniref:Uncharacterized protein n=1 Tax=Sclerotinia nivalis TaxID=352851 RepID=A0A9X0DL11_9HELO|nr:hypothetical protein OCU04_006922 [Sclerotinia nivalis]
MNLGPAEEFPGKKARIAHIKKSGEALDKDETTVVQIKQKSNQAETRNRQNEITESPWPQPLFKPDEPPKIFKLREQSRPRQNIADRDRPNSTSDKRAIDWGILTIQRRKEHQRQLKQKLTSKKARAKRSARALAKHTSKASTLSEHSHILQKVLEKSRPAPTTVQLQTASPTSDVVATNLTNLHKEGPNPRRESRHSPESVQRPLEPSTSRLQTLDEMIEEEREIARQLSIVHESALDPEENRSIRQSRDGLEVASGVKEASDGHRRFCLIL